MAWFTMLAVKFGYRHVDLPSMTPRHIQPSSLFWNTTVEINPYLTLIKELTERTDVLRGYL
ncbi:MAG: hypothetical protein ACI9R8_002002 [Candidatus Paceibacteria bacterium]|jgi:hypothetical protein